MLKTISPLISPELLKVLAEMGHGGKCWQRWGMEMLAEMGHGDEIIFSDAHLKLFFPMLTFPPIRWDRR